MEEAGTPKTPAAPPPPQAPGAPETAAPEAAACPPCPPPEEKTAFPTHFARLFFGAITLLVLYFSYLIIKPYLIDIFLALVLFFTARPLYQASDPAAAGDGRPWPPPSPASSCCW